MAQYTLKYLAELVGGTTVGDADTKVDNALPLQDAIPTALTLVDSEQSAQKLTASAAGAVLTKSKLLIDMPQIVVDDIHTAFTQIVESCFRPTVSARAPGIHPTAVVHASADVGDNVAIGPRVTVDAGVTIGAGAIIEPGVHIHADCVVGTQSYIGSNTVLYAGTRIGARAKIHAGVVIGADGFGYKQVEGNHVRTSQLGWVEIESDVEIGANSTIDRGTYGATRIGEGTKIDNLVQIGHNCHIGRHNMICAQVGIAGSSSTGDYVVLAGQVGIADHIRIANRVKIAAKSGILADVQEGQVLMGSPAMPHRQKLQEFVLTSRLPELNKQVKSMNKVIAALQAQVESLVDQSESAVPPNQTRAA